MKGDAMPLRSGTSLFALLVLMSFMVLSPLSSSCPAAVDAPPAAPSSPPSGEPSAPPVMRKGPYLLYHNRSTAMTVMWQTYETPSRVTIEWGPSESYGRGPVSVTEHGVGIDGHQFSYTMDGLTPGKRVHYRVTVDDVRFTGSFLAAPPHTASSLTFYALGGGKADTGALGNLLKRLREDKSADPDHRQTMVLHPGDYVSYGLSEYFWDLELFDRTVAGTAETLAEFPLMGALGSREGYIAPPGHSRIVQQSMGQYFKKYFPYHMYKQSSHFYYSFDYGPVHVAVADTWSYPGKDRRLPDSRQIAWLTQDLRTSPKPWKILLINTPLWDRMDDSKDLRSALTPLLESSGVRLVLQGRGRSYARLRKNGITYLTLGAAAAGPDAPPPSSQDPAPHVKKAGKTDHFARFEIKGTTMTVTVIRPDGTVVEAFPVTR